MKCAICEKDILTGNISENVIVCGSCILTPLPLEEEPVEKSLDNKYDLSHVLEQEQRPTKARGKSWSMVQMNLQKSARQPREDKMVKTVVPVSKVKSNSIKNKGYIVEDLVLQFDENGIATFPSSELFKVKNYIKSRPNRFKILVEETVKAEKEIQQLFEEVKEFLEIAEKNKPKKLRKKKVKNSEDIDNGKST